VVRGVGVVVMASRVTEASIQALAKGAIEGKENANNLVDLLDYLQSRRARVVKWSCGAIATAYEHLIQEHYPWLVNSPAGRRQQAGLQSSQSEVVVKFRDWMRENYTSCKEQLLTLLAHESRDVQEAALKSLLLLIKTEGTCHITTFHTYSFPNSLLHQVTGRLLDDQTNASSLIGRFEDYLVYDDIRFHWMKNIASVLSFKKKHQLTQQLAENAFVALQPLHSHMAADDSQLTDFFAGLPPLAERDAGKEGETGEDEEGEGREGEDEAEEVMEEDVANPPRAKMSRSQVRALDVVTLQKHRKRFSDAWLACLRLPLSSLLHKKVLVLLHSEVMPHLLEPRLLLDFLVDSYDTGGVVSLLALNGLFILMHHYHLDYPDFYSKLYGLLEPSVFHVKYMPRFFSLMDTYLSSTHLPLYMVAAFAKKVARLALSAPPQGVMVGVVFVTNLLKRHPNCRVLLHRSNTDGVSLDNDPFLVEERDLARCQALESCLWEIPVRNLPASFPSSLSLLYYEEGDFKCF
jgi:U3 small nucleolar RNA-associated protein 19